MSLECSECEVDLRIGHDTSCSRYATPGLDEIVTDVTVSLTDAQIEWLRSTAPAVEPAMAGAVLTALASALPPEPMRLTIELPAELAHHSLFDHRFYGGATGPKRLTAAESAALTAVVAALRAE